MSKVKGQVSEESQRGYDAVLEGDVAEVQLRGKSVRIGWLCNGTQRKLSHIMSTEEDERKVGAKCAAAIVLNGYWGILLLWWFVWRWYYYVMQYSDAELFPIIDEGKKKVPAQQFFVNTMSLIGLRDTMMQMTRDETERALKRFRAEQAGEQGTV